MVLERLNLKKKIAPATTVAVRRPRPTEAMSVQLTEQIRVTSDLSPKGTVVFDRSSGT